MNSEQDLLSVNFEINAVIYSKTICQELEAAFLNDTNYSEEIMLDDWQKRPWWRELLDDIARLLSPIL